jgi:hypothetical protein
MKKRPGTAVNVIPINACKNTENWVMVPVHLSDRRVRFGMAEIRKKRGNCVFARGVPVRLADFIYRAVVKLGLREKKVIVARGTIKRGNRTMRTACAVRQLEWDLGTAVIIPRTLTLASTVKVRSGGEEHTLKWIEFIALQGLLELARPGKRSHWYASAAALILVKGWKVFPAADTGVGRTARPE